MNQLNAISEELNGNTDAMVAFLRSPSATLSMSGCNVSGEDKEGTPSGPAKSSNTKYLIYT